MVQWLKFSLLVQEIPSSKLDRALTLEPKKKSVFNWKHVSMKFQHPTIPLCYKVNDTRPLLPAD